MERMQKINNQQRFNQASELLTSFNEKLAGMEELKQFLHAELVRVSAALAEGESPDKLLPGPIILSGAPGAGKTTAAKMLSEMYYTLGLLDSAVPAGYAPFEFRSAFVGESVKRVQAFVRDAREHRELLFVDEAHVLIDPSMKEVFCALMASLTDESHSFLIVLAVYPEYLDQLLQLDPGAARRFRVIHLPNYSGEELYRIFHKKLDGEYKVSDDADRLLRRIFESIASLPAERSGNARIAEQMAMKLMQSCRNRCIQMQIPDTENRIVEEDDIPQHYLDLLQNET